MADPNPVDSRARMRAKGMTLREYPNGYRGESFPVLVVDDGHRLGGRVFGKPGKTLDDLADIAAAWLLDGRVE